MKSAHRVFVLLGACEDLTERESSALRRGDVDHAMTLGGRKRRLTDTLCEARRAAELSAGDLAVFNDRVRALEKRETENLEFLNGQMSRVRVELGALSKAARQSRKVRRGYAASPAMIPALADGVLGRA